MGNLEVKGNQKMMTILYGSNTGTCQSFAQKLAADGRAHGFSAKAADLDSGTNALSSNAPVVIITPSYEGLPPDNATHFVAWLESIEDGSALKGVQYAVFGCGHKDWSSTFLRVPRFVDDTLAKLGADRIVDLGVSDASRGDMFSDFDSWTSEKFWPAIKARFDLSASATRAPKRGLDIEISTSTRATQLQHDVQQGKVLMTKSLTAPGEPEKRHLEVTLPEGMEYQAGDYLAVLPLNPNENVHRVLSKFSLPSDAVVTIKEGSPVTLPTNQSVSVFDLLRGFVELSLPATRQVSTTRASSRMRLSHCRIYESV
jgi:cytochrome P450/NADPH-cytochrome P450 reductase